MQSSSQPQGISVPFADSGSKQPIPVESQIGIEDGRASMTDGFPPLTRTPLAAGGKPPFGTDMNGILYAITLIQRWQSSGGLFKYDADYAADIGGYPKGAFLVGANADIYWQNTVESNSSNPDAGGAGWKSVYVPGSDFAIDTGSANTYVCPFTPAITQRAEGMVLKFKVKTANTGASTFNDGLGAAPLVGAANATLQGGELAVNGDAWVQWNTSVGSGSYVLLFCTGAPRQTTAATQSLQSVNLAQLNGTASFRTITSVTGSRSLGTTYTNSIGRAMLVNVGLISTATNQTCTMIINGVSFTGSSFPSANFSIGGTFIVPPGATYQVPTGAYTITNWTEVS